MAVHDPLRAIDPSRWQLVDTVRVIGGVLLGGAVMIGFAPCTGDEASREPLPGMDFALWMSWNGGFVKYAIIGGAIGLLVLLGSLFVPRD